jgi:hypothetical protein
LDPICKLHRKQGFPRVDYVKFLGWLGNIIVHGRSIGLPKILINVCKQLKKFR